MTHSVASGGDLPSRRQQPVVYGKQVLKGLVVRPDSRSAIRMAIDGHPLIVHTNNDYINLYHVFDRLVKAEKLGPLRLVRKQVGKSEWYLYAVKDKREVPSVELSDGYDPKRGRYKRYAEQLAQGDQLMFNAKEEAVKARRAWQLYIPAEKRKHLRSTVRATPRSGRFVVSIIDKAKKVKKN